MITLKIFDPKLDAVDGYVLLIEQGDTEINLPELEGTLADLSWDGVWKQDGHYHAVYLTNNEFVLEFVIPDAEWLDVSIRESLEITVNSVSYKISEPPF